MNENQINPKVPAAAAGGGVGGALGLIAVYAAERVPAIGDLPAAIEAAVVVVVAGAFAFVAGYFKRDRR